MASCNQDGQQLLVARDWCKTHPQVHRQSFKWTIDNYRDLVMNPGECICSSIFPEQASHGYKWRMLAYPNGHQTTSEGYLSVGLQRANEDLKESVKTTYSISILNSLNQEVEGLMTKMQEFTFEKALLYPRFISNDKLFKPKSEISLPRKLVKLSRPKLLFVGELLKPECNLLLPGGKLTLLCHLKVYSGTTDISGQFNLGPIDTGRLPADLGTILESQLFSDIDIKVGDRIFKAHKVILAARSPSFRAKFSDGFIRSQIEVLELRPEIFEQMLCYIYTGKIDSYKEKEAASNDNKFRSAIELLEAAHRFKLDELKLICQHQLYEHVSVDSVGEILQLSDQYEAPWLKSKAIKFATCHAAELTERGTWKQLAGHSPEVLAEMLARQWPAIGADDDDDDAKKQ